MIFSMHHSELSVDYGYLTDVMFVFVLTLLCNIDTNYYLF